MTEQSRFKEKGKKIRAKVEGLLGGLCPNRPFADLVKLGQAMMKAKTDGMVKRRMGQPQGQRGQQQGMPNVQEKFMNRPRLFNFGQQQLQQSQAPDFSPEELQLLKERKAKALEEAERKKKLEEEEKRKAEDAEASRHARETLGDVHISGN